MIESNRIVLRPVRLSDREQTLSLRLDVEANKSYMGYPYPVNEVSEERWIAGLYCEGTRTRIDLAIAHRRNGKIIGLIGAKELDTLHQRASFGILLRREYWRKSYSKDAMILFFRYLFDDIHLHRIYLYVLSSNERAIALYEKFGFKKEGVLRKHYFQSGNFQDVFIMGLLQEEFEKLYPNR